ncbi:hypothetical protein J6590_076530 [Homalodisca vitripennis]|nr:hypothetical protein J6590_076530 [Homalodisca vitripennis]
MKVIENVCLVHIYPLIITHRVCLQSIPTGTRKPFSTLWCPELIKFGVPDKRSTLIRVTPPPLGRFRYCWGGGKEEETNRLLKCSGSLQSFCTRVMAQLCATSVLKSASGMAMPVFGLGTWQSTDEALEKALNAALEAGYRLIDTAALYANEAVIGRVLSQWFSSGKLKREDLFITTKLAIDSNSPQYVRESLETQLKQLQLEYVDLYLIHMAVGVVHGDSFLQKGGPRVDMSTDILALWKVNIYACKFGGLCGGSVTRD